MIWYWFCNALHGYEVPYLVLHNQIAFAVLLWVINAKTTMAIWAASKMLGSGFDIHPKIIVMRSHKQ